MTIAVVAKVNDGIVLAADSASTIPDSAGQVAFVYNNANKVINLLKGAPLGCVVWGLGNIGNAAMDTLLKDLRVRFMGLNSDHLDWKIDLANYSVESVADSVYRFIYEETYRSVYPTGGAGGHWGCIVTGYSSNQPMAEGFTFRIQPDGSSERPTSCISHDQTPALLWAGQPEAIARLVGGYDPALPEILREELSIDDEVMNAVFQRIAPQVARTLIVPPMPIADAVHLARFLVEVTIGYSRFTPYAATVGGPIEIAAITKHEGFKWIQRKHYYSHELNPEEARRDPA